MTALLTDNLPLLACAPNGIKKVRELILELAVRGKLVPQDPSDEPACELLKRIAEEKARLVAEGRIRKQKPLAEIGEDEKPFDLPEGWEWTRLGEITNFGSTTKLESIPDNAWVLDLEDIEKDTSRLLQKSRFSERKSLSDKNSFAKGEILYGKLRPYLNKVLVADEAGVCTTEILPFRCYGPFEPHYFKIVLKSPYFLEYVNAKSYGMKMPRLGTENGRQAFFPLPPLAEQHRIVVKVDELMALCDRLEARQADAESAHARLVQALLDSLTQASDADDCAASWQRLAEHFHSLFTSESSIDALKQTLLQLAVMGKLVPQDPSDEPASELIKKITYEKACLYSEGMIRKPRLVEPVSADEHAFDAPPGWAWARLSQITTQLGDGLHGTPTYSSGGEYFFVNGNNLKDGEVVVRPETKTVSEGEFIKHKSPLGDSTVLVSINGTIGNVAFYRSEKIILGKSACYFNLASGVSKYFSRLLIEAPCFASYAMKKATGTTIKNLGLKAMNDYPLALPPADEQHRIVAKLDQLMALCDQLKTRLTTARQIHERLAEALVEQAVA